MKTPEYTLGVRIEIENCYGTDYLVIRVMKRKDGESHPTNISGSWYGEDFPFCENLALRGFASDSSDHQFIGFEPAYHDLTVCKIRAAEMMAKTLKRIYSRIDKDQASEPGDLYMAFCKAIGAQWACYEVERRGSWLKDSDWRFYGVTDGRARVRQLVETVRATAAKKAAA